MDIETQLEHTKPTRRQWRTWQNREPVLAGLDHDGLRHELRAGGQHRQDTLLASLVRLAQNGPHPDLAVAILTACLLPGLRRLIRRYARRLDRREAMQILVTALYEHVTAFDLANHPRFLATRLLSLPAGRLRRAVDTERIWAGHRRDVPDVPSVDLASDAPAAGKLRVAVDTGVLAAGDAWLICVTRVDGLPLRHAARRIGMSYEAGKKRRQRAERRLAARWAEDEDTGSEPRRQGKAGGEQAA